MVLSRRRRLILAVVLVTIVIGFLLLTILVAFFPTSVIDREFSEEIQEHQYPLLDVVMKLVSYPGYMPYAPVMVIATAFIFYINKYKREALFVLLTMLSALISTVAKYLVNRPRPGKEFVKIFMETHQQSFPSGHVLFYVVFFGFLVLLMDLFKHINKIVRLTVAIFGLLMIFIVPVSRIYLGAHWFTDVLGGFLLGILSLFCLSYLYLKNNNSLKT